MRSPPAVWRAYQPQPHDFGRATTDIEDDGVGDTWIEKRRAAGDDESGLLSARDYFDVEASLLAYPGHEHLAVGRLATGFCGDVPSFSNVAGGDFVGADLKRVEGSRHRLCRQSAGRRQTFTESDNSGKRIDDAKARARRPCHQEATVVRAKVKCRKKGGEAMGDRPWWRGSIPR